MVNGMFRIVAVPEGAAPLSVRQEWVGLILPIDDITEGPAYDVLTKHAIDAQPGYNVQWEIAMAALGRKSPEAERWWRVNVGYAYLRFEKQFCELVPD
jgi:hypothetical protein